MYYKSPHKCKLSSIASFTTFFSFSFCLSFWVTENAIISGSEGEKIYVWILCCHKWMTQFICNGSCVVKLIILFDRFLNLDALFDVQIWNLIWPISFNFCKKIHNDLMQRMEVSMGIFNVLSQKSYIYFFETFTFDFSSLYILRIELFTSIFKNH